MREPRTCTTPVLSASVPSRYAYADAMPKRNEYVSPGSSIGDGGNAFVSETTRCGFVSAFLQVTVSPTRAITCAGWKPVARIATLCVAVASDCDVAGAAPAIASVPASKARSFFIGALTPLGLHRDTNFLPRRARLNRNDARLYRSF